jgi:Sulfotransferase domain
MLPNAFIAGAQKSGTTTLCYLINRHPEVVLSNPKEPAFFSRESNLSAVQTYERCFQPRKDVTPRAIVDGSTAYMVDPLAATRIRSLLGVDVRFVFCLRDPVERMISAYWHQAKKGQDLRPLGEVFSFASDSLEEAVIEEENRLRAAIGDGFVTASAYVDRFDDPLLNFRYLRNSLYASDLGRFFENFGRERVKVIFFEDLISDLAAMRTSLAIFLDLDPAAFPNVRDSSRNPTLLARAPALLRALRRLPGRRIMRRLPGYGKLHRLLLYRRPPPTVPQLKERLHLLVTPEVERLQVMLNRELRTLWS